MKIQTVRMISMYVINSGWNLKNSALCCLAFPIAFIITRSRYTLRSFVQDSHCRISRMRLLSEYTCHHQYYANQENANTSIRMNFLQTMALESAARILAAIVDPERVSWKMKPVGFLKMGSSATSDSGLLMVCWRQ